MRRVALAVSTLFLMIAFAAGWYLGRSSLGVVYAQSPPDYHVGGDWGALHGSLGGNLLLFESSDGTIRVVNLLDFNPSTRMLRVERVLTRQ
jgi:hypothetical protein